MALEFKPWRRQGKISAVELSADNAVEIAHIVGGSIKYSETEPGKPILFKNACGTVISWGELFSIDHVFIREGRWEPDPNPTDSVDSFIIPGEVQRALSDDFHFAPAERQSAIIHLITYARAATANMQLHRQQMHTLKQEFERIGLDYDEMTGRLQLKPGAQITLVHPPIDEGLDDVR